MFSFVVKRLGFLKGIPLLAHFYDSLLRLWMFATHARMLDYLDSVEAGVLAMPGTSVGLHRYGGLQFNYLDREFGHLHSNGLLDVLFSKKMKAQLLSEGKINEHHVLQGTGWISFYIKAEADVAYALHLLDMAHSRAAKG